jgi:hypothetical protein
MARKKVVAKKASDPPAAPAMGAPGRSGLKTLQRGDLQKLATEQYATNPGMGATSFSKLVAERYSNANAGSAKQAWQNARKAAGHVGKTRTVARRTPRRASSGATTVAHVGNGGDVSLAAVLLVRSAGSISAARAELDRLEKATRALEAQAKSPVPL